MKPNKLNLAKSAVLAVTLLTFAGCSSVYDKHVQWETVQPENFPVISAIGYAPISLQKSEHETQRMLMAINASKVAAYAELAEQVYGQQIDEKTTVANFLMENQKMTASVRGIIRGAKVVKSYPVGDTYATELILDFKNVYDLYVATAQKKEISDVKYY